MKRGAAFNFQPSTRPRRSDDSAATAPAVEGVPSGSKRPRPAEGSGGRGGGAAAAAAPEFPAMSAPPAEELALASGPLRQFAAAVVGRHEAAVAAALRGNPMRGLLEESFRSAARAALEAVEDGPEEGLGSPEKVRPREAAALPLLTLTDPATTTTHNNPRTPKTRLTRRGWRG